MGAAHKKQISTIAISFILLSLILGFGGNSVSFVRTVAASRTWTVDDDGSADYHVIQQAIDRADNGDTILVFAGTYYEHLVVYKSLSIIGEEKSNTIIDGGGYGSVVSVAASGITLKQFTLRNGDEGVIVLANENNITDNVFLNNEAGVLLDTGCEGNLVSENEICFSATIGVYGDRCGGNVIANNNISFNNWHGIFLYASQPSVIDNNSISMNAMDGMRIRYSSNNTITRNIVSGNDNGIYILSDEDPIRPSGLAKYNMIENNVALNNSYGIKIGHYGADETLARNQIWRNLVAYNNIGLNIIGSQGNSIYNNNFISNSNQTSIYVSSNNTWDCGYYAGGNYWSDHNGTDIYWGLYQNETGSDGIVDLPYQVLGNPGEEDRYPFLYEDEWLTGLEMSVVSPAQGMYRLNTLPLILTVNKPAWLSYSLDSQPNITIVKNSALTNLSIGVHNITINADDAIGNHMSSNVIFTVTFLGDLSLDGTVNILDISIVAYSFGQSPGGERWNPDTDLNTDDTINILDIAIVALEFGNTI